MEELNFEKLKRDFDTVSDCYNRISSSLIIEYRIYNDYDLFKRLCAFLSPSSDIKHSIVRNESWVYYRALKVTYCGECPF